MELLRGLFERTLADLDVLDAGVTFDRPSDTRFGDYSTNIAMQLFSLKRMEAASPRALAENIIVAVEKRMSEEGSAVSLFGEMSWKDVILALEVAGPGFINVRLALPYLTAFSRAVEAGEILLIPQIGAGKKAVVEYSSPNIAKPFTIGHLRSTIIGDSVAHLLAAVGFEVFRDNHLGDWGTQFGKLIYAIKTWGDEATIEESARPVKELVALYVKFHDEADKDPSLEDAGRAWFKKLEDGDSEARRLWQKCIDWSWVEFNAVYSDLAVLFTENGGRGYGESYFENDMTAVVSELASKKLLVDSQGAKIVEFPNEELPPLMIMKQDGATLYATRDLATDAFRLRHYSPDVLIVNEVGAEQSLYFRQLYKTEELLGWVQPGQRVHVKHGLYRFKDKKMSTRKGNVIWMEDVLAEAKSRAALLAKDADAETVQKIAVGALKWNDLKRGAHLDVIFDWDELLSLQGNSGPYVQYSLVRMLSVLEKAGSETNAFSEMPQVLQPAERALLALIERFPSEVAAAAELYAPHVLCTYVFSFSQAFNAFYDTCRILTAETESEKQFRLSLVRASKAVLEQSLGMLGIPTVKKM